MTFQVLTLAIFIHIASMTVMKNIYHRILQTSRPRFRIYELWPYLIGIVLWSSQISDLSYISIVLFGLYFLLPANILIYGINDIYDYDTDLLNPKKQGYESVLQPQYRPLIRKSIIITNLPFGILAFVSDWRIWLLWCLFIFFAVGYSTPPLRAKARPILDMLFSAGHYVTTGVLGYVLVGGSGLHRWVVAAGVLRCMAMHAYSAIPDIAADREVGLSTVATLLWPFATLLLCTLCYAIASMLIVPHLGWLVWVIGSVYIGMMLLTFHKFQDIMKRYRYFPTINMVVGGILFRLSVYHVRG